MTGAAIILVLLSAFAHATWNFLVKRAGNRDLFTWWMGASANIILLPLAVVLLVLETPSAEGWLFAGASWGIHLAYFTSLTAGYRTGDLSLVYPVARGTGLVLIPVLGVSLLGERMSPAAIAGVAVVGVGIFVLSLWGQLDRLLHRPFQTLRTPGLGFAVLTGLLIAVYSTLDKRGVEQVTPLLYMYVLTSAVTIGMLPRVIHQPRRGAIVTELRAHPGAIAAAGLCSFSSYALVLFALQVAPVSYVGPFREVSLVVGALLGTLLMHEPRGRLIGAGIICAGALAIAFAP